jgi:hypothetical protein
MRTSDGRSLLLIGLLALLVLPGSPGRCEDDEEWTRPYLPVLPECEPLDAEGPSSVRSVYVWKRGEDGPVPVRDAVITGHTHRDRPTELGSRLVVTTRTDEYGIANIVDPSREADLWQVVAPGMSVHRPFELDDDIQLFFTGGDYRFRILDPDGAPLVGARVGHVLGCPHGPSTWTGTTDENGEVTLERFNLRDQGDLWIVAEGVGFGSYDVPLPMVGDGNDPPTLRTDRGVSASGLVLDEAGAAVAGVVVRDAGGPRGPVTVTDAEGRFVLYGLYKQAEVAFFDPRSALRESPRRVPRPRADFVVSRFTPDVPLRVVLRKGRPSAPTDGEARSLVDVAVAALILHRNEDGSDTLVPRAESEVPVRLVRLTDGYTVTGRTDRGGRFTTLLPAGSYRVTVGENSHKVVAATKTLDLPRPDAALVAFVLDRKEEPPFRKRPKEKPAPRTTISLKLTARSDDILIRDIEQTRGAFLQEGELGEDGVWRTETNGAGPTIFVIRVWDHQPVRIETRLPTTPGHVDLGEVVLEPLERRTFRAVTADGTPVPVYAVTNVDGLAVDRWAGGETDESRFAMDVGKRPVRALVTAEGWYPMPVMVGLETPETIRFPAGRLTFRVRDREDRPLESHACLDGRWHWIPAGKLVIRGVPDGPHTLIIGARGHIGEVRRIVIREGEAREIDARLRAR